MTVKRTHTMRLGATPWGSLFVTVEWDGSRLSLTGVEGPKANGDAKGSCGQCVGSIDDLTTYAPEWDKAKAERLKGLWERWHLNDMRAGSPAQEEFLRANPVTAAYPETHYDKATEALDAAGLNPEGGRYGHRWNFEEVPASVVAELFAFPVADVPLPRAWEA